MPPVENLSVDSKQVDAERLRLIFLDRLAEAERAAPAPNRARRVAGVVGVGLLLVTVGATAIGLGGSRGSQRPNADPALAVARAQITQTPTPVPTGAAAPAVAPTVSTSPSATTAPNIAPTTGPTPSVAISSPTGSPSTGRTPPAVPPTGSVTSRPAPAPTAVAPKPTTTAPQPAPRPAGPFCTVGVSTTPGLLSYSVSAAVTNKSANSLAGWSVSFALPGGYFVTQVDGGSLRQSGGSVTVSGPGTLAAAGGRASFSFRVGVLFGSPNPGSGYTLNGNACA